MNQRRRPTPRSRPALTLKASLPKSFPTTSETATEQPAEDDRVAAMLRQELESVDFYIAQGYVDIAIDTLDLLEQQCGGHPDIISRREQINQLQTGAVPETNAPPVIEHGEDDDHKRPRHRGGVTASPSLKLHSICR